MSDRKEQIAQFKAAIESLEAQRSILGDAAVNSALEGFRQKLAELEGDPSSAPQPEGERRQATIVFSDLSGYTAMNEKLDPEEVQELMSRIKAEAVRIVEHHEGTVNQFVGDEIVALFGIPNAHEDDPARAVRAALEFHQLVRQMSQEVEAAIGQPLRMHTGINTGLIVTNLEDERDGKFGITGDTVNTGARILAQAKADEILVSPETQRLIAPYFKTESMEPVNMKGKTQPMVPSRILGKTTIQTRIEAAEQRGFTTYTGREEELATLDACLEKALQGEGQFVTVMGEAGLGKSRLLYEFRNSLDRKKINVLQGRCQSYGSHTPYLPFIDALRRGLGLKDEATPEVLHETAVTHIRTIDPVLEEYIPHYLHLLSIASKAHPLPDHLQGEALRLALQEALVAILTLNASHKPMVVILEDWHWVDEASDVTLKHLLSVSSSYPLLLVVLYRPEYNADWSFPGYHTPINLSALTETGTKGIACSVLEAAQLPEGLDTLIHERTGGNPFFIEELCSTLLEEKAVLVKEGLAALTRPLEKLDLPDTVQAVIRSRLDRLDSQSQEVLRLASVIGREFAFSILERIATLPTSIAPTLEKLKIAELIQQIQVLPEAEYMFKHVLAQVVVYETLLLQQRKELHGLVAQAIEEVYEGRLEEQVEMLAFHYSKSNQIEKGLQYLEQAGIKAVSICAFPEANQHYQTAIALLDSMQQTPEHISKRIEITLRWLNAAYGNPTSELLKSSKISLDHARKLQDDRLIMRLSRHIGIQQIFLGELEGHGLLIQSLELAKALEDERYIALSMDAIGRGSFHSVNLSSAFEYLEKSTPMMSRLGIQVEASYSHSYLAQSQGDAGMFAQARRNGETALSIATQINHLGCKAFAGISLSLLEGTCGNWKRAVSRIRQEFEMLERLNYAMPISYGKFEMGWAKYHLGKIEEGITLMQEGIKHLEPADSKGWMPFLPRLYGKLAYVFAKINLQDEAEAFIKKTMALDFPANWGRIYVDRALALLSAHRPSPDWSQVENHMKESIGLAETLKLRPDMAQCHLHYAELLCDKGDFDKSKEQLNQATELFIEMGMTWWLEQAMELEESVG